MSPQQKRRPRRLLFQTMEPEPQSVVTTTGDYQICSANVGNRTQDILRMRYWSSSNSRVARLRSKAEFATLNQDHAGKAAMTESNQPGGSVFLVEDEVMIRMMVADMLEDLGYSVAAEAGDIVEATRLAGTAEFDVAILDVNVNGKVISPVAEALAARNKPFIFATGYGAQGLPEDFRDRPTLQKPFQMETLAQVLAATLKGVTV